MNVTVEYFGQLRQFAGAESEAGRPGEGRQGGSAVPEQEDQLRATVTIGTP